MSRDLLVYVAVVVCFAAWITVHVVTAGTLFFSARKKLAAIALFVPFAAPLVAIRNRERTLGVAWVVFAVTYAALRFYARA